MNTKALRQKILDLAIHGKLVPQDPNDEPASVLLERIKAEKERLIKEGKIKRTKRSKAACDKPHYPFELPKGWCWCKLYDIVEFIGGYAYKSNTYVFSKKGIRNSQSNMQTFSISPQDRTKILSLQIRRDGTCVKKYFSLLAQGYTWASTSIQGFG